MRITTWAALAALASFAAACGEDPPPPKPAQPVDLLADLSYQEMKPTANYPLKKCVVCDKDLGASRYTIAYRGYEVQLCDKSCMKGFAEDPEGFVKKINPRAMFDGGVK